MSEAIDYKTAIIKALDKLPDEQLPLIFDFVESVRKQNNFQSSKFLKEAEAIKWASKFRLSPEKQKRLSHLLRKNAQGRICQKEIAELDKLVDEYEDLTTSKAEALCQLYLGERNLLPH
jgi:hypothetical protein